MNSYRSDIDGLRAIAVIAVIFFHADLGLPGGYLGVDVFFVISGYLITSIILRDVKERRFSFMGFYERRARRILPALTAVCAACILPAYLLMLPDQFEAFGWSLIGVASFVSNIVFYSGGGYFGSAAETEPLLHTWSLAVEEQFYLIFPLMILVSWRLTGRLGTLVVILAFVLISLALSHWASSVKPLANFFLTPTRVWELFAGSLCALAHERYKRVPNNTLAALGLCIVIACILSFHENTPMPSLFGLIPIAGTMLIMLFGSQTGGAGLILSSRPMVWVGLVSYSAYLIHQPLLAFLRLAVVEPSAFSIAATTGAVAPLSYLSWRYVEQPFRRPAPDGAAARLLVFTMSGAALMFLGLCGVAFVVGDGFASRYTDEQRALLQFQSYPARRQLYRQQSCMLMPQEDIAVHAPDCTPVGASYAIWGDSHAAALSVGFRAIDPLIAQLTAGACPPILDYRSKQNQKCAEINQNVLIRLRSANPRVIVLEANWSGYIDDPAVYGAFSDTVDTLLGQVPNAELWIVGTMPQWKPSLPMLLVKRHNPLAYPNNLQIEPLLRRRLEHSDERLSNLAASHNRVSFFSIIDLICNVSGCPAIVADGERTEPLVWDSAHMTELGANFVVQKLLASRRELDN